MPRIVEDLQHWLTNKERNEQIYKLGRDICLRTVQTVLAELQSRQLVAAEGLSTTS